MPKKRTQNKNKKGRKSLKAQWHWRGPMVVGVGVLGFVVTLLILAVFMNDLNWSLFTQTVVDEKMDEKRDEGKVFSEIKTALIAQVASSRMTVCARNMSHNDCRVDTSTRVNIPRQGTYTVVGNVQRGTHNRECQSHEDFDLYIDGEFYVSNIDDDVCEPGTSYVYRNHNFPRITLSAGNHTIRMLHRWRDRSGISNAESVGVALTFRLNTECGNGVRETGEQCDTGGNNGRVCTPVYGSNCTYCNNNCQNVTIEGPNCGDGTVDGNNEQCDDGEQNGRVCTPAYGGICTYCDSNCESQTLIGDSCGDGTINGDNEQCDDGEQNGVVPSVSYGETATYCRSDCTEGSVIGGACGDGEVEGDEQCDDGNTTSGDGCSSTCQDEDSSINLTKLVSESLVEAGETVTYTYRVDNEGEVSLTNLNLTDDRLGDISCPETTLGIGESMTCTRATIINAGVTNTAVVEGNDPLDNVVTASDTVVVNVESTPEIIEEEEEDEEDCNSSIGNYIWYDTNGNGVQEDIEEGIEDIKVCAFNGNKRYCDTTDKNGRYKIKDLCAGSYDVVVKDVGEMSQTYDPDGKKDNKTEVKLRNNDKHTKADFGYRGVAPVTGLITNIILLIGLSTLLTIGILMLMKKKGAL